MGIYGRRKEKPGKKNIRIMKCFSSFSLNDSQPFSSIYVGEDGMKKKIIINFTLVRRIGFDYVAQKVCEKEGGYSAGIFDEKRRRDFEEKTFKSDLLFSLAMGHGTRMAEYLARVITKIDDIEIERVLTQKELINEGHSVRLDALAIAKDGMLINFEMQNERRAGMEQRLRMYESSINLSFLAKGDDYENLPDIITIVLYDYDVYGRGKALYTSCWREIDGEVTGRTVVRHEVNLRYEGEDDIGELGNIIHDFGCWDYRKMRSEVLSEEMRYFKTTKEGEMGYGGEIDGYINEGKEIGLKEGFAASIKTLISNKLLTKEQIAKAYGLSLSEVEEIAAGITY